MRLKMTEILNESGEILKKNCIITGKFTDLQGVVDSVEIMVDKYADRDSLLKQDSDLIEYIRTFNALYNLIPMKERTENNDYLDELVDRMQAARTCLKEAIQRSNVSQLSANETEGLIDSDAK